MIKIKAIGLLKVIYFRQAQDKDARDDERRVEGTL